ncbi:Peptidoglycan/LPS O-acetylase OafA/YrhL, contains acyltransferase and SGNH-hydrolase domains [Bradyrhizobium brasilense]|uniref:Peptidoglycan/LPS O-acetylase OafA/YrhL, contains acyltransferase and SGNH-hydrolase domains n=1 Tax=Bradyrhizobium brasilense TaxID=1419277 RepID=A0A1G6YZH0_9BRAD|nr:acyltransferase [Bradyrhizobium brasilense]SDD95738.1 Peptidoglycan/LPS O-acetylase OafA/YrhL, contains acyltransferase and SGNH-hydrolase domains [Bradyrhizobium brasilense]
MQRIDTLTALRAFAAAALVYYHQQGVFIPVSYNGAYALGVSFFFVLSGFILCLNYGALRSPRTVGRFMLARFARLYPVHLFTFVLFGLAFAPDIFFNPDYRGPLLTNAVLLHSWVPVFGYVYAMNPVSWSISDEFFFYLIFPFASSARSLSWIVVGALAATIVALLVAEHFDASIADMTAKPWEYSPVELALHSPIMRVAEFITGIWFARLYSAGTLSRHITRYATALELACVGAVILYGALSTRLATSMIAVGHPLLGIWLQNSAGLFVFGALMLVVAHQAGAVSRVLRSRLLVFLGETSFCLYMVHVIIIQYMNLNHVLADHAWWMRFAVATSLAYVGSFLIWRTVEVPMRRLILWRPRRATPAPVAKVTVEERPRRVAAGGR